MTDSSQKRVLVVDDDRAVTNLLREILEGKGHQVILAGSGEEALIQLRVDAADILLFNPETKMLEFTAGRGFRGKGIQELRLRLGEGLAGRAAIECRTQSVPILSDVSRDATRLPPLADEGFVSYSAVPLIAKGQVRGILDIFRRTALQPDQEWLDFCGTLAGLAAIAIDNATQYENMGRSNLELALAYDATVEAWARSLDMREGEPVGHASASLR